MLAVKSPAMSAAAARGRRALLLLGPALKAPGGGGAPSVVVSASRRRVGGSQLLLVRSMDMGDSMAPGLMAERRPKDESAATLGSAAAGCRGARAPASGSAGALGMGASCSRAAAARLSCLLALLLCAAPGGVQAPLSPCARKCCVPHRSPSRTLHTALCIRLVQHCCAHLGVQVHRLQLVVWRKADPAVALALARSALAAIVLRLRVVLLVACAALGAQNLQARAGQGAAVAARVQQRRAGAPFGVPPRSPSWASERPPTASWRACAGAMARSRAWMARRSK